MFVINIDTDICSVSFNCTCVIKTKLTDRLKGKNVVITGGSAGIGEQLAYHYARSGAQILITAHTEANLKKV